MRLIYSAGKQAIKCRIIMWLLLASAMGSITYGWYLFQSSGMNCGAMTLEALPDRLIWALGVSTLGIACAVGIWYFGRIYIAQILVDEGHQNLEIQTLSFLGFHRFITPVEQVGADKYHPGQLDIANGQSTDAPWCSVRIAGRRLPLLLDAQGMSNDVKLLRELLHKEDLTVNYKPWSNGSNEASSPKITRGNAVFCVAAFVALSMTMAGMGTLATKRWLQGRGRDHREFVLMEGNVAKFSFQKGESPKMIFSLSGIPGRFWTQAISTSEATATWKGRPVKVRFYVAPDSRAKPIDGDATRAFGLWVNQQMIRSLDDDVNSDGFALSMMPWLAVLGFAFAVGMLVIATSIYGSYRRSNT
jgi:hypothetical protein